MAQLACPLSMLSTAFLHQSRWNITMDFCLSFNSLIYCLYCSGGISCLLAELSNLTCKLDCDSMFFLSCKSCCDSSVGYSAPSAIERNLFSLVDGAILSHKCSGGLFSISSTSTVYLASLVCTLSHTCL